MKQFIHLHRRHARRCLSALAYSLAMVLPFLLAQPLAAQCDLACNGGNPNAPLSIPITADCELELVPESVLEVPIICPGDKILTVRDEMNSIIVSDTNFVVFDPLLYYGDTLSVTVTDVATGIFCNSFITPVDLIPPDINCTADTISCITDTSAASVGLPVVTNNCIDTFTLTYEDTFTPYDCDSSFTALLEREWTAVDTFGNESSCTQLIYLDRPDLNDLQFPADTVLDCDVSSLDLDITGQPLLFGEIVENTNGCELTVTYADDTLSLCGGIEYQVQRNWTVMEGCSGQTAEDLQIINVVDTVAPQITCPGPITVSTNPGFCFANITLPSVQVTDNCDSDATFFVSTSFGAVGLGPHSFVPVGTHTVQYTSIDACGNSAVCTTTLNVIDDEPPSAVCEDLTTVSITSGGVSGINAITFDDGSNDNCAEQLYFKARRMTTGGCDGANGDDSPLGGYQEWFDDRVYFCCEEVGENIQVIMRVYELDPGTGPVTPTREIPGGDLFGHFTECMVSVEVQDKLAPTVVCPSDTVVDCATDFDNLDVFGTPFVADNCGFEVSLEEEVQVSNCGTGVVTRTFTAVDPSGNVDGCIQTITAVNQNPFSEDNIIWPEDYTATTCGSLTDPEDLPEGFDYPQLVGETCSDVGVNYTDEFFNIAFPGCYKILREWVIIDWCQYDPEDPSSGGRFTDVQIIKVEDINKPILDCPDNVVVGIDGSCGGANVTLPDVEVDDCNANILVTNDSPHAEVGGGNASGFYPMGTTVVEYVASDRCGNTSKCEVEITVEDLKAPSPVCIVGLSVNLADMDGETLAMLNASSFDGGSSDNCTADEDLQLTLRKVGTGLAGTPPSTSQLTFTCEDVGTQMIEFWAQDEAGNSAFCVTAVAIQDNNGLCPQTVASGMIAGDVTTESGDYVDNVMVEVMSDDPMDMAYTGNNGFFELLDLPFGNDYTLKPSRNDAPQNGISTFDMILISRHILGVQPLNTPYKMIAADVNRSGTISTLDLIAIRKLILGIDDQLPNGNTSWRFVDANHLFLNPNDPFVGPIPEKVVINDFEGNHMDANFVAIKVGDVDLSAQPNEMTAGELEDRSSAGTMVINVPEMNADEGEEFTVPFTAAQMDEVLGYQFTLRFNTDILEYVELNTGALPSLSEANFNLHKTHDGWITTSWNVMDIVPQPEETPLFSITFRARRAVESLEDLISISGVPTADEAYNMEGEMLDVGLNIGATITAAGAIDLEGYELYQNRPNPFSNMTVIGFKLPVAGEAQVTVFDMSGKVIFTHQAYYGSGQHEIVLKGEDLGTSGLLYYQLRTANYAATRKMILMD